MTTPAPAPRPAAPAAGADEQFGQGTEHCCARCGASAQVGWCHAWQRWYCPMCRTQRTDKELKPAAVPPGQPVWRIVPPL